MRAALLKDIMLKPTLTTLFLFLLFAQTATAGPIPWSASDDLYLKLAATRTNTPSGVNLAADAETLLGITEHLGMISGVADRDFLMELVTTAPGDAVLGRLIERITASLAGTPASAVPLATAKQPAQARQRTAR
jgi:hypothetical protein